MNSGEQQVQISFGRLLSKEYVTWLGGNSYRLEATPLLVDLEEQLWLGDVVYLEQTNDGVLQFRGVASKSRWRHVDWIVGANFRVRDANNLRQVLGETAAFTAFKKSIETAGGKWEQALGGILFIHLPEGSHFDPDGAWAECLTRFGNELSRPENGLTTDKTPTDQSPDAW